MVSQAQGFVHLLATAAEGGHEPQVFRMRWDQPLRRFAKAYSVFREFGPEAEGQLKMSTKGHGELDLAATASVYGLANGDHVVFSLVPPEPANIDQAPLDEVPEAAAVTATNATKVNLAPQPAVATSQTPSDALMSADIVEATPAADAAKHGARDRSRGHGRGRGRGRSGGRGRAGLAGTACSQEQEEEDDWGAAEWGAPRPKAKPKAKGKAKAKSKSKAKSKAKAKAKAKSMPRTQTFDTTLEGKPAAPVHAAEPLVPRGHMRSETIKMGPAKGWRVVAWLHNIAGRNASHGSSVRWRISSPGRTRTFSTFRTIQDEEGDGVYAQIYTAVRPNLLRRINQRRMVLEGYTTPEKRRRCSFADEGPTPKALRAPPAMTQALVTQQFTRPRQARSKTSWVCGCEAHLRRHPHCVSSGHLQPAVVHLRDHMLIGRGESCDVVLNSSRTPQMISRCHALLQREEGAFTLSDQASLNGVLVNGEALHGSRSLEPGDVVTFGVPSQPPEFDYVFEVRPAGLISPHEADGELLATQLHAGGALAPLSNA
mmetsp:Transcript_30078/g.82615  ORF Transcript_30078/g.82615 Transcript_30078/m.82615 type:complete len:542 (-) Transcript_30078:17-1642(-)